MWIPEFPKSGNLWNPESWALESGKQLKESGIPLTIRIRNPSFTDNESDPRRGIQTAMDYLTWGEMNFHMGLILKAIASFVTYTKSHGKLRQNSSLNNPMMQFDATAFPSHAQTQSQDSDYSKRVLSRKLINSCAFNMFTPNP